MKSIFGANVYHVPVLCLGIGSAPNIRYKIMAPKPYFHILTSLKPLARAASHYANILAQVWIYTKYRCRGTIAGGAMVGYDYARISSKSRPSLVC